MKIKDMMHKGAECVAPDATLQQIAKKMKDFDVGAIPVCEGDKAIGMVTDRDITISLAGGKDVSKLSARDLMSALCSAFPGTNAAPFSPPLSAASRLSRDRPPLCFSAL